MRCIVARYQRREVQHLRTSPAVHGLRTPGRPVQCPDRTCGKAPEPRPESWGSCSCRNAATHGAALPAPRWSVMHILINATSARLGGGITVLRNLIPAMARVAPSNRYSLLASPEIKEAFQGQGASVDWIPFRLQRLGLPARIAWEQPGLPILAAWKRADVLFCPGNLCVALSPIPQVVLIHNVAPFDPPVIARATPKQRSRFHALRWASIVSARRADRVAFVSDYSRRAVGPQLGLPQALYRRIHTGTDPRFRPVPPEQCKAALAGLGIRGRYLLSVSQFYHYKNFVELVQGFALAVPRLPQDLALVIVGAEHEQDYARRVRAEISKRGLGHRILLKGHVPYEQLPAVYSGAEMFVFPSTCENFPNILVEGMASGAPTLTARVGPMPEIAGEGAKYFDPFSPRSIADAILELWHAPEERLRLSQRGAVRAVRYTSRTSFNPTPKPTCTNETDPSDRYSLRPGR